MLYVVRRPARVAAVSVRCRALWRCGERDLSRVRAPARLLRLTVHSDMSAVSLIPNRERIRCRTMEGMMTRGATLGALVISVALGLGANAAYAVCCVCQAETPTNTCSLSAVSSSCDDCAAQCASVSGTMLACCPGGGPAESCLLVADSCGMLNGFCFQTDPGRDGFCQGTCLGPTFTPIALPTPTATRPVVCLGAGDAEGLCVGTTPTPTPTLRRNDDDGCTIGPSNGSSGGILLLFAGFAVLLFLRRAGVPSERGRPGQPLR